MALLSIIIVNYNGKAFLQDALDSLKSQSFQDFEVILVDNNSVDGSIEGLQTDGLPNFALLPQTENLGFAAGNNLAAKQAHAPWLVLMNPDTVAHDDWLEQIGAAIHKYPDVSMYACAQLSLYDAEQMDGAGDCYLFCGIPWRGGFERPVSEMPAEGECFSPCGASAVFRRSAFEKHNGFDERYFCYCEDVDLGYRMQLSGERCIFLPNAIVRHAGSGISGQASEFSIYHGTRNRLWTYFKNTPPLMLIWTLPFHIGLTLVILLRGLVTGRAKPTWRGLRAGLKGLGALKRDKRYTVTKRTVPISRLLHIMAWHPARMLDMKPVVRSLPVQHSHDTPDVPVRLEQE